MPITNYANPSALAPAVGWQPEGARAGAMYAERNNMFKDQLALSELVQEMAAQKQAAENQAAAQVRPHQTLADIAKAQATQQTAVPRAQADMAEIQERTRKQKMENDFNAGTYDTRMREFMEKARDTRGERAIPQLQRLAHAAAVLTQMAESSSGAHVVNPDGTITPNASNFPITPKIAEQVLRSLKVDPELDEIGKIMMNSPATSAKWKELITGVLSPEHVRGKDLQSQKDEADYKKAVKVAEIEANARIEAAGIAAEGSGYEAKALIGAYVKDVTRLYPDKSPEERGRMAADMFVQSKYGAGGGKLEAPAAASDRTLDKELAEKIASDKSLAAKLPPGGFKDRLLKGIAEMEEMRKQGSSNPSPSSSAKHTLAEVMAMYPGKSEAEVKAAYKAKHGVEPR